MYNVGSINSIHAGSKNARKQISWMDGSMIHPYGSPYTWAAITRTLNQLLVGHPMAGTLPNDCTLSAQGPYDRVVLILVDGLGWGQVEPRLQAHPLWSRVTQQGVLSQLTSQWPSTTAVQITTLMSGLPLAQHGIPEYHYYDPEARAVINPFKCKTYEAQANDSLAVPDSAIYPSQTFYDQLASSFVDSHIYTPHELMGSRYNTYTHRGAKSIYGYGSLSEGLGHLRAQLETPMRGLPQYHYVYYPGVDGTSHQYGPNSPQTQAEVENTLGLIEKTLLQDYDRRAHKTAFVITADHGQVEVNVEKSLMLDQLCPELEAMLITDAQGRPVKGTGSKRDAFIYARPEKIAQANRLLSERLGSQAVVLYTQQLIEDAILGRDHNPSQQLLGRLPSLVILPRGGHTVWWSDRIKPELGHHGGMSQAEMLVPFGFLG